MGFLNRNGDCSAAAEVDSVPFHARSDSVSCSEDLSHARERCAWAVGRDCDGVGKDEVSDLAVVELP